MQIEPPKLFVEISQVLRESDGLWNREYVFPRYFSSVKFDPPFFSLLSSLIHVFVHNEKGKQSEYSAEYFPVRSWRVIMQ